MELIKEESISTSVARTNLSLPAGQYEGLLIRISGTNASGQALAVTDMGQVKLVHNNNEIVNASFSFLSALTNLRGGVAEASSSTSGAFAFSAILPFRKKHDKMNVLVVEPQKTTLIIDGFTNLSTKLAAAGGTIEVCALYDVTGYAKYLPIIKTEALTVAAAMTASLAISTPYIEELYGVDDANISRVALTRDGARYSDGYWSTLEALSNARNAVETAITTIEMVAPRNESMQNVVQTKFTLISTAALTSNQFSYSFFAVVPFA